MSQITSNQWLRIKQIIGDPKANPPIEPMVPVSSSTWWSGVKAGKFPAPSKLSARVTVWKLSDILKVMEKISAQEYVPDCGYKPRNPAKADKAVL